MSHNNFNSGPLPASSQFVCNDDSYGTSEHANGTPVHYSTGPMNYSPTSLPAWPQFHSDNDSLGVGQDVQHTHLNYTTNPATNSSKALPTGHHSSSENHGVNAGQYIYCTPDDYTPDDYIPDNYALDNYTPDNYTPDNYTPDKDTPDNYIGIDPTTHLHVSSPVPAAKQIHSNNGGFPAGQHVKSGFLVCTPNDFIAHDGFDAGQGVKDGFINYTPNDHFLADEDSLDSEMSSNDSSSPTSSVWETSLHDDSSNDNEDDSSNGTENDSSNGTENDNSNDTEDNNQDTEDDNQDTSDMPITAEDVETLLFPSLYYYMKQSKKVAPSFPSNQSESGADSSDQFVFYAPKSPLDPPSPATTHHVPRFPAFRKIFQSAEGARRHRKQTIYKGFMHDRVTFVKRYGRDFWVKRIYEAMIDVSSTTDTGASTHLKRFTDEKHGGAKDSFDQQDLEATAHHIFEKACAVHERGFNRYRIYHRESKRGAFVDLSKENVEKRLEQICKILRHNKSIVNDALQGGLTLAILCFNPYQRAGTKEQNNTGNAKRGERLRAGRKALNKPAATGTANASASADDTADADADAGATADADADATAAIAQTFEEFDGGETCEPSESPKGPKSPQGSRYLYQGPVSPGEVYEYPEYLETFGAADTTESQFNEVDDDDDGWDELFNFE
ncbi:hypothetical protein K504DRAFT_534056 [Pleomassaria siparia CBS 279.74]|uniref:Uncharacterized protein n=1 Tax=Pleomassaria siparia CBS 279.74 TaxID=1314801 RepID=A0A6G1KB90_9PLEO|nr:hypothetical protein K504DRAFT_534056 [Pleomassaria siparia CBS 279.74]